MSSVEALREFIKERLTAAAGEIFTVFEQTIVQLEEIDRQNRLLQISLKAPIKVHTTESPQQKSSSSLEQEEHEAPHIKEEEDLVEMTVADGQSDNSLDSVRDLTSQRLTAAAVEIFSMFEQTVVQYKEKIDRQNRLLEINWNPQIRLHRIELQQNHNWREEQTTYCLEQEEPEPPLIKEEEEPGLLQFREDQEEPEPSQIEEQEELGTSQEGERLTLKFESETLRVPSVEEQSYLREPEEEQDTEQFLCHDSQVQHVKKHLDSESTLNAELKTISIFHSDRVNNFPVSEKQDEGEKILCEETCGETVCKKPKSCQKVRTVTDKKKILCEICGQSYNTQSKLLDHMRTHTGEKPCSCETCGKSFRQWNHLLAHMRTHTGEKPHSCETCGKSFSYQYKLLAHMRTHTGEKPHSCETCGKRFRHRSHLLAHMRTHTGEKPYSCGTCGKRFSLQHRLISHMRIHTGEKPFSCETCGKSFSDRGTLKSHMRTHTGEKPHSCEICGKSFRRNSNFKVHKRTHR